MKGTTKKKNDNSTKTMPKPKTALSPNAKQRQRSILEALGVLSTTDASSSAPPHLQPLQPRPPPALLPGQQRSLDGLAKVVRKNRKEKPVDVLARCLAALEEYRGAVGGGKSEGGAAATTTATATGAAASAAPSSPCSTSTSTEDQARAALRELSCVRVDASLIAATGAGTCLREFRKDPQVAVALSMQAERILGSWSEAVVSEVRARRRYRAHAATAVGGGGGTAAAAVPEGKAAGGAQKVA